MVPSGFCVNFADTVDSSYPLSDTEVAPYSVGVNPLTTSLSLTFLIASLASEEESASSYDVPLGKLNVSDSRVDALVIVPVVVPFPSSSNDAESVEPEAFSFSETPLYSLGVNSDTVAPPLTVLIAF